MILIIGGAHQGKMDFTKETFGILDADVYSCGEDEIDFSKRCIYKIEAFPTCNEDPIGYFAVLLGLRQIRIGLCCHNRDAFR